MATGYLLPGLLLAGAVFAATRKPKKDTVKLELVHESGKEHPSLGLVVLRVFESPDGFTWTAEWEDDGLEGLEAYGSDEDAYIGAIESVALEHGEWEGSFGEADVDEAPPAGPGSFEYRGATIWISEGKSATVGGVFRRIHQWSATGPSVSRGGTGTAGSATEAWGLATTWVDDHPVSFSARAG